ncbi:MAG: hypothetical protein IPG39_21135 [Bacteroidetes bacterium]|nr:hypothetical protein [Bacteroidota bacterium]
MHDWGELLTRDDDDEDEDVDDLMMIWFNLRRKLLEGQLFYRLKKVES